MTELSLGRQLKLPSARKTQLRETVGRPIDGYPQPSMTKLPVGALVAPVTPDIGMADNGVIAVSVTVE